MRRAARGLIPEQEEKYLALLLDQHDPVYKEAGLELLCKRYRAGYRLSTPHPFLQRFNGLLHNASPKVVRWALNAIAVAGTRSDNLLPALDAIQKHRGNHDVMAAGVAAFAAMTPRESVIAHLKKIGVPFQGAPLLAVAQHTTVFSDLLARERVRPDRAEPPELRLATVLVGLNRAPENLFEPKHSNAAIVGVLNGHHDRLVAQYSVWAICENPNLSVDDLRIALRDVASHPDNVRGWIYQLIASRKTTAIEHREYLAFGSEDESETARLGLAMGLKDTFFDGIEEITVDWYYCEASPRVRAAILDHMAGSAERCAPYAEVVRDVYSAASGNSLARLRLEAASRGTPLYGELRRIAINGETLSLFGSDASKSDERGPIIVNQNISGQNVNIGNLSGRDTNVGGNATSSQSVNEAAQKTLAKLIQLLEDSPGHGSADGLLLAAEAQQNPTKSTIERVLTWMRATKDAATYAVATGAAFGEIFHALTHLMPSLHP